MAASMLLSLVVVSATNKTILRWSILEVPEEVQTIEQFFRRGVLARIAEEDSRRCDLLSAYIGKDREMLDHVDLNLPIVPVVVSFGPFLKFVVRIEAESLSVGLAITEPAAGQSPSTPAPSTVFVKATNPRNKKDHLFNDIVAFLESASAGFYDSELILGNKLVVLLRDIFWHIDGHHHIFEERAQKIPSVFRPFVNYNVPERSKHRKRVTRNISSDQLGDFALELSVLLRSSFWERCHWCDLKPHFTGLLHSLSSYQEYLVMKNKKAKANHRSPTPVRELADNLFMKLVYATDEQHVLPSLKPIDDQLKDQDLYHCICINSFLPTESMQRHRFIDSLTCCGLSFPSILLFYTPGSNVGNIYFMWRVLPDTDANICFEASQSSVECAKKDIPIFHTRAMRSAVFKKFGRVSPSVKPAVLRYFYKDLTGDQSAASSIDQSEIDQRIQQIIDMEDADIIADLRSLNGSKRTQYDTFWEECGKFLNEEITPATDDRRHGNICHLSRAISVRDLVDQVKLRCPPGTLVPSCEWVRLQFWPKTLSTSQHIHHTGRFKIKYMVQQRQWRHQHIDAHYAAATYKYLREYALFVRDYSVLASVDDKHKVQVGEPSYPVAATERGRRVMVREDERFIVGDHDFTKFSIVPSVTFLIDIPEDISDSWYKGLVFVGLKDVLFEPSSPFRHMCELDSVLRSHSGSSKPILFLYSDGGPDHRLTYYSVKLSLICLFLKLDLDYLCAARTAPYHSWRNPVERVMSILNLGLQCVGLSRQQMSVEFEKEVGKCNTLTDLRKSLSSHKFTVIESLSPVKSLLSSIFTRLKFNDEFINTFSSATVEEVSTFWSVILTLDSTLGIEGSYNKEAMKDHPKVLQFITHCCQESHYSFDILKCGKPDCEFCKPIRLPIEVFNKLNHIPHPVLGDDGHYLPFNEVFGLATTDEQRPSFKKVKDPKRKRAKVKLHFSASVQHVKNSEIMVQCCECGLWRLVFSKYRLKKNDRDSLRGFLEDMTYSCGSFLKDLNLPDTYKDVEIRDHDCYDPIEKLYYSANYEPICYYCGIDQPYTSSGHYPQCNNCIDKPVVAKK